MKHVGWVVLTPYGDAITEESSGYVRENAQNAARKVAYDWFGVHWTWKRLYRRGYRCKKLYVEAD